MGTQLFALRAQRSGPEKQVAVFADGRGLTVDRDGEVTTVRSLSQAIEMARHYIGEFLQPAQRPGVPWGLLVTVPEGVASYGEWPLAGGGGGSPDFRRTRLVQIRERWEGGGPLSALANAMQIVEAYTSRSGGGRRAA